MIGIGLAIIFVAVGLVMLWLLLGSLQEDIDDEAEEFAAEEAAAYEESQRQDRARGRATPVGDGGIAGIGEAPSPTRSSDAG